MEKLISWLNLNPTKVFELVRPENISNLFPSNYGELETDTEKGKYAIPVIEKFIKLWMTGQPLNKLEEEHEKPDFKHCKNARHFAIRLVPDLAFLAALPVKLLNEQVILGKRKSIPLVLSTLGACVREGCENPSILAIRHLGKSISRVAAPSYYKDLKEYLVDEAEDEAFEDTLKRVRQATAMLSLIKGV
jgi:hypothetical protein